MNSSSSLNAFDLLMAGSRRLNYEKHLNSTPQLPQRKDETGPRFTQKDAMYNHILSSFEKGDLLFENKEVADRWTRFVFMLNSYYCQYK